MLWARRLTTVMQPAAYVARYARTATKGSAGSVMTPSGSVGRLST